MQVKLGLFCSDTIHLSLLDVMVLLFGKEVEKQGIIIGLWKMPKARNSS